MTPLLQILLIWAIVIAAGLHAGRLDRRAPADDLGIFWLIVLAAYSTFPTISWLLQGESYQLFFGDYRLYYLNPLPEELSKLLNIALAYVGSFAAVYVLLRKHVRRSTPHAHPFISNQKMIAAFLIVFGFQLTMFVISGGGLIRQAESYIDSYLVIQELPLGARQALKIGNGMTAAAAVVFLVGVLQRWPKQRYLMLLYLGLLLPSFDPEGSRASLMTGLLAIAFAWHVLVRPIKMRSWIVGGVSGLIIFLALGLRRQYGSWAVAGGSIEGFGLGEFDALWANAIELLQARELGSLAVPMAARFGEFWAFIPSQFLPFEKLSLAEWFLSTFHFNYQFVGGGLGMGAIAQAVVGDGALEAGLRGAVLALISVYVMHWYRRPTRAWWHLPLYLYLLVFTFQSVRDTTFRILTDVVQIVLPALIVIAIIAALLPHRRLRRTDRSQPNYTDRRLPTESRASGD